MLCTRRTFLKNSAMLSIAAPLPLHLLASTAAAKREDRDTVLVALQLSGGNDGLNTVVPYTDEQYASHRPTLALPVNQLHKINSQLGFHPRMKGFSRLHKQGRLSIIQAVACPNLDRGHETAMRVWHTADPQLPGPQTGWLGRTIDHLYDASTTTTPAVFVGPIATPFALNAARTIVPAVTGAADLELKAAANAPAPAATDNELLDFAARSMSRARLNSDKIEKALKTDTRQYPPMKLAGHLRTVSQLIRADLGIRIFLVEIGGGGIGGFDNHANQLGNHCALLEQLSESVAAFIDDLAANNLLDKVCLMTYSEFGRTLTENGRHGTGHGLAAPMFLAGGKLKSPIVGSHPSLTDLIADAPKFNIDFRSVYAAMLQNWLGFESKPILGNFKPLDLFKT